MNRAEVAAQIASVTGQPFTATGTQSVGGGCINSTEVWSDGTQQYFVKTNRADRVAMFEAEYAGLMALKECAALRVPEPLCTGVSDGDAYLVMEYLPLGGGADMQGLGRQLAQLHRCRSARFGWQRDNTIGATPQHNDWHGDWPGFYRDQRLGYQLRLAASNGFGGRLQRQGERLLDDLPQFFPGYAPSPSLLHGDLWSGNVAGVGGEPVIYDPATYYGDREADIAMTELFGGFSGTFYAAYREAWPLDAGYPVRRTLYNLYHILNHANLFGGGYAQQAEGMIEQLLAEL